jgi:hypothetical protein
VTATIDNGTAPGTDFTQDFGITVQAGSSHIAVTGISGVPESVLRQESLTFSGTVEPATATNQSIVWSVNPYGATSASITNNSDGTVTLNTTSQTGIVTVTATIENGATASTPFTKEFDIVVLTVREYATTLTDYLTQSSGGSSASDPILLEPEIQLTEINWSAIIMAIGNANKYVSLDLSDCTRNYQDRYEGLRSNGDFDPTVGALYLDLGYEITNEVLSRGKSRIVNLTLPTEATGIVEGDNNSGYAPYTATFVGYTALKTVSGAEVTSIGTAAFGGSAGNSHCPALGSVSFPKAVTIGGYAFDRCTGLESVRFPEATTIGGYAFNRCTRLESVSFPKATFIGKSTSSYAGGNEVFSGCTSLTSVTLGATPPSVGEIMFYSGIHTPQTVTVKIPVGATAAYGAVSGFDNDDTSADHWGNAFRGKGWDPEGSGSGGYSGGDVNGNITLEFQTY